MLSSRELLDYLEEHGTSSETQMALHFKTTVDMVAMMFERLRDKGRVKSIVMGGDSDCGCGGGCACSKHDKPSRYWQLIKA